MREIYFRGKRTIDGQWVYGYLVKRPSAVGYTDDTPWYIITPPKDPDDEGCCFHVDPDTVGQDTGLVDKNGVKIFEGDVCTADAEDGYFELVWCDEDAMFLLVGNGLSLDFNNYYFRDVEVIGNVTDNPELLGERNIATA